MSQQKSKKTLINWDLVSVNPNDKNWNWKDLFCFWGVNVQSVIGFSLITSLYIIYSLNTFIVFFGTLLVSKPRACFNLFCIKLCISIPIDKSIYVI